MAPEGLRVGAVVLAAGRSTRMGHNKLLLELEGESLVRRATRSALRAGFSPVIVVVGYEADRVRAEVDDLVCTAVPNPAFVGPASRSLHAGLRALGEDVAGAIVLLPDMVHVTAHTLRGVRAAAEDAVRDGRGLPLVVSRYGDVTAPPILFPRALFPELLAWTGEGCGKPVVRAHEAEAVIVDWPVEDLDDVDTPEDFARIVG